MARELARGAEVTRAGPPTVASARVKRWVIRNEDLPLFTLLGDALLAGLTPSAPGIVKAVIGVARLALGAWKKGARLIPVQVQAMRVLELRKGTTPAELAGELTVTPAQAEDLLRSLARLRTLSGGSIAIVREDSDGRWFADHSGDVFR